MARILANVKNEGMSRQIRADRQLLQYGENLTHKLDNMHNFFHQKLQKGSSSQAIEGNQSRCRDCEVLQA
jgi:hypothetical protein